MRNSRKREFGVEDVKDAFMKTKRELLKRFMTRVVVYSGLGGFCGVMSSVYVRDFADVTSLAIGVGFGFVSALWFWGLAYRRELSVAEDRAYNSSEMIIRAVSMFERAEIARRELGIWSSENELSEGSLSKDGEVLED